MYNAGLVSKEALIIIVDKDIIFSIFTLSYSFKGFSEPAYKLTISVSLHCKDIGIESQE